MDSKAEQDRALRVSILDCGLAYTPPNADDSSEQYASLNYVPLSLWKELCEEERARERKILDRANKRKLKRMKRLEKVRKTKARRIRQSLDDGEISLTAWYFVDFLYYLVLYFFLLWALEYTSNHDSWLSEDLDGLLETVFR